MNLAVTTVALIQTDLWVLYVVCYLVCCDSSICVDCFAKICACPLCCVCQAELGLIPFNLELTFTSFPFRSVGTSHTPSLTHYIVTALLLTELYYLPLCGITIKALPYDLLLGLLHQMVWGLIGTSYRGDPLNMLVIPKPSINIHSNTLQDSP